MAASDFTKLGKADDDIMLVSAELNDKTLTVTLTKADGTAITSSVEL